MEQSSSTKDNQSLSQISYGKLSGSGRKLSHIVVAGGLGSRFGAEMPKQFHLLSGRPVLMHTLERLRRFGQGGEIVTVLHHDWHSYWRELCDRYGFDTGEIVDGGDTRWQSVKNGLSALSAETEIVTIHDGARPLIDEQTIQRLLNALHSGYKGAIPTIPLTDSIRHLTDRGSIAVRRAEYRSVQTPQAFMRTILEEAYSLDYSDSFTDDASVVEALGVEVALVEGSFRNIKITYPADLALAEYYLAEENGPTAAYRY